MKKIAIDGNSGKKNGLIFCWFSEERKFIQYGDFQ